jgi:hypothetical protein
MPCATASDCGSSALTCVPFNSAVGGLCDYANFNIKNPDAGALMTCTGECQTAADCCELPAPAEPSQLTTPETVTVDDAGVETIVPGKTIYLDQCASILGVGLGGDPTVCSNSPTGANAELCFYYQLYCACAPNTWACTNNACVYTGPCTVGSPEAFLDEIETVGQCPTETRATKHSTASCTGTADAGSSGSCQAATCTTAASCNGSLAVGTATPCQDGDCTCYQDACYFPCAQDLDCSGGFTCDATNHVCKPVPERRCITNNDCVGAGVLPGLPANATAICDLTSNTCKVPCAVDHDCSLSSGAVPALGAFSGNFCSGGFCTAVVTSNLACMTNADCESLPQTGSVNMFCVTPAASTSSVTSAVTSGAGDGGM